MSVRLKSWLSSTLTQKRSLNKDSSHYSAEVCKQSVSRADRGAWKTQVSEVCASQEWLHGLRFPFVYL